MHWRIRPLSLTLDVRTTMAYSFISSLFDRSVRMNPHRRCGSVFLPILILALMPACKRTHREPPADAGRQLPAISSDRVDAVNNAAKQAVYTGPTGAVEGTITMSGDEAPDLTPYIDKIPANCASASSTYGRLFREGPGRVTADVLVAATGYKGYVKPVDDHVNLLAKNCSWERRTIALTFGQRLDVRSTDALPYIPQLLGAPTGALLVAVPKGEAVPVVAREPGHYVLIDAMRLFSKADVFVVRYPTTDVTGLDGRYRIEGIPVGPVTVSALLPSTGGTTSKSVAVESNRTSRVDFTLTFDKSNFDPSKLSSSAGASGAAPTSAASGSPVKAH